MQQQKLKLQYALKIALFNFALDSFRAIQEAEPMNAPRGGGEELRKNIDKSAVGS